MSLPAVTAEDSWLAISAMLTVTPKNKTQNKKSLALPLVLADRNATVQFSSVQGIFRVA